MLAIAMLITITLPASAVEIKDGEVNNTGTAIVSEGNGYLTIEAKVNAEISDTVYVQFFNIKTYEEYAYYLYAVNDYKTSVELPAGSYIVSDGGLPYDTKGLYRIEEKQFVIKPSEPTFLEIGIGMEANQLGVYDTEETEIVTEIYTQEEMKEIAPIEPVAESQVESDMPKVKIKWKNIATTALSLLVLFGIMIYIIKKKEGN